LFLVVQLRIKKKIKNSIVWLIFNLDIYQKFLEAFL